MSFSISGLSSVNTRINQVQATLQTHNQNAYQNAFQQFPNISSNASDTAHNTYNAQGKWNNSDYNNQFIANSFDSLNRQTNNYSNYNNNNAVNKSYNFNKEVLGAYVNMIR